MTTPADHPGARDWHRQVALRLRRWVPIAGLCALGALWFQDRLSAGAAPQVAYVTPGLGTGAGHTFTFVYSDVDGATDIATTEGLIASGTELNGAGACYFFAAGNRFFLRDDTHTGWLGPVIAGTDAVLANSQCTLAAAGSSIVASSPDVAMTATVTFSPSFAGAKTVFTKATDRSGSTTGWIRGGMWIVAPLSPRLNVVTSACADAARDPDLSAEVISEQGGRVQRFQVTPACFPRYSFHSFHEGYFTDNSLPLPIMGRTAGHFNVLVAFVDNDANRRKLLDNTFISDAIKSRVASGHVTEALTDILATYTPAAIMSGLRHEAASVMSFTFTVGTLSISREQVEWGDDGGLGFARYDAVLVVDDLGRAAGNGVHRWPSLPAFRPVFLGAGTGIVFNIDPRWLSPGLFGNELLRRNVPTLLAEYQFGQRTLVVENGVTYDRTPIVNPRTGENIEPLVRANVGMTSIGTYINGWADLDGDGVIDCVDPEVTPTADNVDGDFIPDRFDPDLAVNHRPYSWMYADRGGVAGRR